MNYTLDAKDRKTINVIVAHILSLTKGYYTIRISKGLKRSLAQNNTMWMYYEMIANEVGYSSEEIHELMGRKFLSYTKEDNRGTQRTFIQSTTELTTVEFMEYLEKIKAWAAEYLTLELPDPV